MKKPSIYLLPALLSWCWLYSLAPLHAADWNPICVEGSSCRLPYSGTAGDYPYPGSTYEVRLENRHGTSPLVTDDGIVFNHLPQGFLPDCDGDSAYKECIRSIPHLFSVSATGVKDFGSGFGYVTDANAIKSSSGRIYSFWRFGVDSWSDPEEGVQSRDIMSQFQYSMGVAASVGPPVIVNNHLYYGTTGYGGGSILHVLGDENATWESYDVWLSENQVADHLGEGRYNLLETPEKDGLWANVNFPPHWQTPPGLWERPLDINPYTPPLTGAWWYRVDDGSFPVDTQRVVHDPSNPLVSYALTTNGLFVSTNRGVSWQASSYAGMVHGMVFVERDDQLPRMLVLGTDSGVIVSIDEATSWQEMSSGLLSIPHTVTNGLGMLVATSDAGYFSCNALDCAGTGQLLPPENERDLVEVVEFYNTDLDHYFVTATVAEATGIDQGLAGPGWVRTGKRFLAWGLASDVPTANVCRFYGSVDPGPNSHFYSLSARECSFLMDLQEIQPAAQPRWNFEGYAFSMMPVLEDQDHPCRDDQSPVYRAYNNGFVRGDDSNHRYVTDRGLLTSLVENGWTDEGVVFCSPSLSLNLN